jgi:hypothetical protein
LNKLNEGCHKLPSHIPIVYPISPKSSLFPKLSEYKKTKQLQLQQLEAVNKQAKQEYDELFVGTNHKFSISTKEALHLNDLYNNRNKVDFDPTTLPYEEFSSSNSDIGKIYGKNS